MRKVINGKAYDTETATHVARVDADEEWSQASASLYRTRGGAWFEVAAGHDGVVEEFEPRTDGEARRWLERNANHLVEKYFGEAPEASSTDHADAINADIYRALGAQPPLGTQMPLGGILSGRAAQTPQPGAETSPASLKDSTTSETSSPPQPKEVFTLKPGVWGMSVDLKELFRRAKAWWKDRK